MAWTSVAEEVLQRCVGKSLVKKRRGESAVLKCWDECCSEVLGKKSCRDVLGRVL